MKDLIEYPEVESKIVIIRNKEVLADADVADLFGGGLQKK
jgi:hypothetical protein